MSNTNKKAAIGEDGIFDARQLGMPKMLILGIQHMFAMFGATVLVPALTGLSVSTTLLFAGLGTLLFHFLARGRVPAFLGSSFAFLAGYWAIAPKGEVHLLPYGMFRGAVFDIGSFYQSFWDREGHEIFPAHRDGADYHCHRFESLPVGNQ